MMRTNMLIAVGGILIVCITTALLSYRKGTLLEVQLDSEKLKNESLLSEKLQLEKTLDRNNRLVSSLNDETEILKQSIAKKDDVILNAASENRRLKKNMRTLRDNVREHMDSMRTLKEVNRRNHESLLTLETLRLSLSDSIDLLQGENLRLITQVDRLTRQSIDQTLMTALKKNERRITSKARATRKLVARVNVPTELDELTFTIEGPDERTEQGSFTSESIESKHSNVTASLASQSVGMPETKTVEIIYTPKDRLREGLYSIKIFNKERYVGSLKVKLRK